MLSGKVGVGKKVGKVLWRVVVVVATIARSTEGLRRSNDNNITNLRLLDLGVEPVEAGGFADKQQIAGILIFLKKKKGLECD